jgi:hypothetical protein
MRAYSSMPTSEFVAQLRDIAIKAGARALVIDQIDAIVDAPSEEEIEQRINEAVDEAEKLGFEAGEFKGESNKETAIADALQEQYDDICEAIRLRGQEKDIGLTETQLERILELLEQVRP